MSSRKQMVKRNGKGVLVNVNFCDLNSLVWEGSVF